MKTIALLTSGGDSPGMNAALRAAAKTCAARGVRLLGVREGYEGLIDGRMVEVVPGPCQLLGETGLDVLGSQGGTVLGSARSARFREPAGRARAANALRSAGVEGLVVIGGNGSLTGAHILAREHGVRVMGIPASIDNDIGCSAMAIGTDTALNTIVRACDHVDDTARAHRRAFVVEVMGRACGYLAMASAVAVGADAVLFREQKRDEDAIVEAVASVIQQGFARGKRRVLIIKAEGVEIPCTRLVRQVEERLPELEVRAVVLGHVVRGGNPTSLDRLVSARLAFTAVMGLLEGATDEMVGWNPTVSGGAPTADGSVKRFPLERVLQETAALEDGSSPVMARRLQILERIEGVLPL
ncbi:MAG TPA: ATP-dependent 6-phosphofructokinase [Myxococcaceae bacterium]|nr:ATP-dependent 6-phosphofructokinase [Myxococcaceae bacterium]